MNIILFVFALIIVAKLSYDTGYKTGYKKASVEYPAKMSVDLKPTPTTLDDNK